MSEKPVVLAQRDIDREARRVFRRLAEPAARLQPITAAGGAWGIFVRRNRFARAVVRVEHKYVFAFDQRDWLDAINGGWRELNQTGRAWYHRASGCAAPFREQHQLTQQRVISLSDGAKTQVTVNAGESSLGWLRNRKGAHGQPLLNAIQFEAGERFREDYERAQLMPRVTSSWVMPISGRSRRRSGVRPRGPDVSEAAIAAKARVSSALAAVGPDLAGIVIEICCNLNGLKTAEKALGMPQRSGKIVLQIALNHLARHYGLLRDDRGPRFRQKLRHWGGEDYRPAIDG